MQTISCMKVLLQIFLILIIPFASQSQKVYGSVFNDSGDLLPYASITIKGTTRGASANNKARFSFSLSPGKYVFVCQHIGYETVEKTVNLQSDTEISFILKEQKLTLNEVVIQNGGEDPAYEIIRQAIKKRNQYDKEVNGFQCDRYSKDLVRLNHLPKKVLGQKVPDEDRQGMGLDSTGKGIIYLSESISKIYTQRPDKFKMEVISSRVSGSGGFGFSFPTFISLYKNNVSVFAEQLNPRGFVSPIADGAIGYYKFKLLGSYFEDGKMINSIRVTPRRKYEPLFTGIINIIDDTWRIHSFDLLLTKTAQLELIDSLSINQLYVPVSDEVWRVKNQLLQFKINMFGVSATGQFLSVYSNYKIDPVFNKDVFNRVTIKYDTAVNKKSKEYWDSIRPVPLENEELKDYKVKDSLYQVRLDSSKSQASLDSLNKRQGKIKPAALLLGGINRTHFKKKGTYSWRIDGILPNMEYNNAEGVVVNLGGMLSKHSPALRSALKWEPHIRYGFSNTHVNAWANLDITPQRKLRQMNAGTRLISLSGGKRVTEFFRGSSLNPISNSFSILLYGQNFIKTYENWFGNIYYNKTYENGVRFFVNALYEDRIPLNNTTLYTFRKKDSIYITPNYPQQLINAQFTPHQAFIISGSISIKPGQKYIQLPYQKLPLGSKYPTFTLSYAKGIKNIFGSDVDFDKWQFKVTDDINLRLAGLLKYNIGTGGFLNHKAVPVMDYQHFNGNMGILAGTYVNSFQMEEYYAHSTIDNLYGFLHLEHHLNGLLTNKIPLFKRLNWNLVTGTNILLVNKKSNYSEVFFGIENILKVIRADYVLSFNNGSKVKSDIRLGFGGILGSGFIKVSQRPKAIPEF